MYKPALSALSGAPMQACLAGRQCGEYVAKCLTSYTKNGQNVAVFTATDGTQFPLHTTTSVVFVPGELYHLQVALVGDCELVREGARFAATKDNVLCTEWYTSILELEVTLDKLNYTTVRPAVVRVSTHDTKETIWTVAEDSGDTSGNRG